MADRIVIIESKDPLWISGEDILLLGGGEGDGKYIGKLGNGREVALILEDGKWYKPHGIGGREEIKVEDIKEVRFGNWVIK